MRLLAAVPVLGLLSGLAAQSSAGSPPAPATALPAVVLLLQEPVALEVEPVRGRWARVVKATVEATPQAKGVWLAADGATLVGGRDGLRFVVRAGGGRELGDQALRHLDDEDRAELRAHRAAVEVACTSELARDTNRAEVYRLLGGVVASLGARGVLGVGASDHGTFDPAPPAAELRQALLGKDPLAWLEPEMGSSLVVLTRKRIEFTGKDLEARIGKELGITFSGKRDATEFVVVYDAITIVKVGDAMVMLTWRPAVASMKERAAGYDDLRLRKLLGEHDARLHMATRGPATEAGEAERRRLLARLAAALWHDDFLVFSWHCNQALLPAGVDVPKQLRAEDPVAAMLGQPVLPVVEATEAAAMDQAMARARREWATAVAHHGKGGELSVKLPFRTRKNGIEHIWVAVTRIEGDTVHGTLANEPADIAGKKFGDAVAGRVDELSDWLFLRDGAMVGGFTVEVLRAQQARQQPEEPAAATAPAPFTFAWPVPCAVQIVRVGEKRGQQAKLRYRLDVQAGDAGELRVRHSGFEFLEVAHEDATTPAMKKQLAPAVAMAAAVPDILVDANGRYLRVDGIETMIERVMAAQGEAKGRSAAEQERMAKLLRAPEMLDTLQQACGADWLCWAGAWVGFDVPPQQERAAEEAIAAFGESLPAKITRRHHGEVAEHPGHVRLSLTSIAEGEAATKAFAAAMERIAKQSGGAPFPADRLVSMRIESVAEVVVDPKTLRPVRASRVKTMRIAMKDEAPREQVERFEFTFAFEVPAPK